MKKFWKLMKTELTTAQTVAGLFVVAMALLSLGAASVEQLSVDYTTRACAQNVNFTGTFQVAGIAPASANTASAIVKRDGSGNFAAGTITATLTGTASGNLANARITSGAGAPSTTPGGVGYFYFDTSNHKLYAADAAVDSTSWFITN